MERCVYFLPIGGISQNNNDFLHFTQFGEIITNI